jgi:hypothetical protein
MSARPSRSQFQQLARKPAIRAQFPFQQLVRKPAGSGAFVGDGGGVDLDVEAFAAEKDAQE